MADTIFAPWSGPVIAQTSTQYKFCGMTSREPHIYHKYRHIKTSVELKQFTVEEWSQSVPEQRQCPSVPVSHRVKHRPLGSSWFASGNCWADTQTRDKATCWVIEVNVSNPASCVYLLFICKAMLLALGLAASLQCRAGQQRKANVV